MFNKNFLLAIFLITVVMFSCSVDPPQGDFEGEIVFDYALDSVLAQVITQTKGRSAESITGKLIAKNLDSGKEIKFNWYGVINEEKFKIESSKTIKLPIGNYDFSILFTKGVHHYYGQALMYTIKDGQNKVPLTMRPVIGDTTTVVELTQVASIKIKYSAKELSVLKKPSIGLVIDGNSETILTINPETGISEQYLNLTPSYHKIHLNLYDGELLVGVSETDQEGVVLDLNQSVNINIRPLYGETMFDLTMDGGDARFTHIIPKEIVAEAGGLDNLRATFALQGHVNGYKITELTFSENGDGYYTAIAVIGDMYFDVLDISIEYFDKKENDKIATCSVEGLKLTVNRNKVKWPMVLRRRAFISGHILSVVGINAFLDDMAVEGVKIYANGKFLGLTGSGRFGTSGFLNIHLIPGKYTIRAIKGAWGKEEQIFLTALQVTNLDFILEKIKEPLILFDDNDYGCGWENYGSSITIENSYEIGTNIAVYAAGGETTLSIGHIKHNGDWNPDPSSLNNLKNQIEARTGLSVSVEVIELETSDLSAVQLLYITGHNSFSFNTGQEENLKTYIENGGVLFADDCSNVSDSQGFETDLKNILIKLFGNSYQVLPADHPIYSSFYELDGNNFGYSIEGNGTEWNTEPLYYIPL